MGERSVGQNERGWSSTVGGEMALFAFIAFVIGLIVRIVKDGSFEFTDVWIWLFLGLALLALSGGWAVVDSWRRRGP